MNSIFSEKSDIAVPKPITDEIDRGEIILFGLNRLNKCFENKRHSNAKSAQRLRFNANEGSNWNDLLQWTRNIAISIGLIFSSMDSIVSVGAIHIGNGFLSPTFSVERADRQRGI